MPAVLEFCTAVRSGPPMAEMAATSSFRLAPWATERMVPVPVALVGGAMLVGGSARAAGGVVSNRREMTARAPNMMLC